MNKLKDYRLRAGLTMKELGARVGVSESAISHYEKGRREPDIDTINKLADVLHVSVNDLIANAPQTADIKNEDPVVTGSPRAQLIELVQSMSDDEVDKLGKLIELMYPDKR